MDLRAEVSKQLKCEMETQKKTQPQTSSANQPKKNRAFTQGKSTNDVHPIMQIEQQPSVVLSDAEEKYKEKVLCYIDNNGVIEEGERSLLELKRIKYGLSEEQAAKVEELCKRLNG